MNGGSDLTLALAVANAGGFPSYWYNNNVEKLYSDLSEFIRCTGHSNIIVGGISNSTLSQLDILKVLHDLKISHVEILATNVSGEVMSIDRLFNDPYSIAGIKFLKKTSKILTRIYEPTDSTIATYFDAFCIKGLESAGKTGEYSVSNLFDAQQKISNTCLIPYGGIGTPGQVKDYINRGAVGVAVGTLFAASLESTLSIESKNKLINASSTDLTRIADTKQNSLLLDNNFKTLLPTIPNDWNRQDYLNMGLRGNGNEGLMYVGSSVDHIDKIKPIKDIIEYLASEL